VYRVLFDEAGKMLGQPIVISHRTGAGFTIAAGAIARSNPDGYTIGYPGSSSIFVAPFLQDVPYHPLKDFQPIAQFSAVIFALIVRADSPFKTFQELLAHGRQHPTKATYGTNGINTIQYFVMEHLLSVESAQLTHVPYRGASDIFGALMGKVIDAGATAPSYSHVETNQHRLLLLLSDTRSDEFPNVPNLKDLGYDLPVPVFIGASGPVGIPKEVVTKLEDVFAKASAAPAVVQRAKDLRVPLVYRNSRELTEYISRSFETYEKLVKKSDVSKK
jgi:tripartite-type tricarboxylate transporter receptor subunit TctC